MDNLPKPAIQKNPEELVAIHTLTRKPLFALGMSVSAINGLPEPEFKKVRLEQEEPKESGVTMDDLPELPFEKILGYLSLQERIKCRAVSRRWCKTIDSFRPKSLCISKKPSGYIYGKSRWVSGEFARNFIYSARFDSVFGTFGESIFSNLKHLRLCDLLLHTKLATEFTQTLYSFCQLEQLDLNWFFFYDGHRRVELKLNLPMLNSIQIIGVNGIDHLTLDAPKLQNIIIREYMPSLNLNIVRVESVEKLIISGLRNTNVKNLKNLKYIYIEHSYAIDSTPFISGLKQLKEIHLLTPYNVKKLFEQKERNGRDDLKIFYFGCLLSGPNDPAIDSLNGLFLGQNMPYLADHLDGLADQIPFCESLNYLAIERVPRGSETSILNRLTDLHEIYVSSPVQDIERFLDILKSLDNIADIQFEGDQAQDLFDRLPDCCAVQKLTIHSKLADFGFLFRLSHLIELNLDNEINVKFIREVFKKLKFLLEFRFYRLHNRITVDVEHHPKRFKVWLRHKWTELSDLDSAIRFIVENAKEENELDD